MIAIFAAIPCCLIFGYWAIAFRTMGPVPRTRDSKKEKLTIQKMRDDLDYWIHIDLAEDIINAPEHREEYQHLVKMFSKRTDEKRLIIALVMGELDRQLQLPSLLRPTFWILKYLTVKNFVLKLFR